MSFCSVLPSGPGSDSRRPALPVHTGVPDMGSSESGQDLNGLGLLISDRSQGGCQDCCESMC